jgi:hypothetical protein
MPKNILAYGTGNLDVAANAISSTANFLKAHGWRPGAGYQPGEPNFNYARHAISIDENRKDFARVPWSSPRGTGKDASGIQWFEQVWFAGKHSDIGGSSGKRIEVVGHRAGAVMHASVYRRFDHEAVRLTDAFGAYSSRMPDDFSLSSTDTIIRSPALNPPSSQSALPRRAESCFNRSRTRSSTRGRRSLLQGLSPSRSLAVASSRIAGSTVLSAANIHVIARARASASSGSRPAWRSAIWKTIDPVSNRARSPSS